jgi:hypothetical protein
VIVFIAARLGLADNLAESRVRYLIIFAVLADGGVDPAQIGKPGKRQTEKPGNAEAGRCFSAGTFPARGGASLFVQWH